jgi:hypothetical protein
MFWQHFFVHINPIPNNKLCAPIKGMVVIIIFHPQMSTIAPTYGP